MRGGDLLVFPLKTGVIEIWEVESIELGGTKEISVVCLHSMTRENSQNGKPIQVCMPANMLDALIEHKLISDYTKVEVVKS
jgi:hypothetical protein